MRRLPPLADWPPPEHVIRQTFRAPLDFVFRWCTDFDPDDARREHDTYRRKVVLRHPDQVVYEDLEEGRGGWSWARYDVRLQGPRHWQMESLGTHRLVRADYQLTASSEGTTTLELRLRRRPSLLPSTRLSRRAREASISESWKLFARALESDYRRSPRAPRRPAGRRARSRSRRA